MIDGRNQVGWALMLYQLKDAEEHLTALIRQMNDAGKIEEVDFEIQIGHIYGHLNRAWNGRNLEEGIDEAKYAACSNFPNDLGHMG